MTHPHDQEPDEWAPRERGLLMGNDWAQSCRKRGVVVIDADGNRIDPVVAAAQEPPVIPDDLRRLLMEDGGMRERLDASEELDPESAFWAGFQHGVRAYLVRVQTGTDN